MRKPTRLFYSLIAIIGMSAAHAATLSIDNHDFETGGFSSDDFTSFPGEIPTGWSSSTGLTGNFYGYYNPDDAGYIGTDGSGTAGTMAGPNVFYFGSAVTGEGIYQVLSDTFEADTDYDLTVALGARDGGLAFTASLTMNLYAGSTLLATSTVRNTASDGSFSDFTLNYTYNGADAGLVGQNLKIEFLEDDSIATGEVDIDNVRLTSNITSVPEASTSLMALGGAAVLLRRRRA
jgi:hypothetical protein